MVEVFEYPNDFRKYVVGGLMQLVPQGKQVLGDRSDQEQFRKSHEHNYAKDRYVAQVDVARPYPGARLGVGVREIAIN